MTRTSTYQPGLAWFAALGSAWVFVLVALGAFTTSIGAGMAFADWPLSNGSVNPHGWLTEIDKFAEHSHRLSGAMMGLITIALAVWLHRTQERAWLRRLGWWAILRHNHLYQRSNNPHLVHAEHRPQSAPGVRSVFGDPLRTRGTSLRKRVRRCRSGTASGLARLVRAAQPRRDRLQNFMARCGRPRQAAQP